MDTLSACCPFWDEEPRVEGSNPAVDFPPHVLVKWVIVRAFVKLGFLTGPKCHTNVLVLKTVPTWLKFPTPIPHPPPFSPRGWPWAPCARATSRCGRGLVRSPPYPAHHSCSVVHGASPEWRPLRGPGSFLRWALSTVLSDRQPH